MFFYYSNYQYQICQLFNAHHHLESDLTNLFHLKGGVQHHYNWLGWASKMAAPWMFTWLQVNYQHCAMPLWNL